MKKRNAILQYLIENPNQEVFIPYVETKKYKFYGIHIKKSQVKDISSGTISKITS
mgnify:CR=1 FL=1